MTATPVRYGQRKAWHANAARVGRRWRSFAALILGALVYCAAILLIPHMPIRQWLAGFILGAVATAVTLAASGIDDPVMRGDMAEGWTRDAIKKLSWPTVHTLSFEFRDIDHVVVAPCGVLAVETKYRFHRTGRQLSLQRHADLDATRTAASKLRSLLRSKDCKHDAQVFAVLVVWGPGSPDLADGYKIVDDVTVVDGDHPELWSHLFKAPLLTNHDRDTITSDLRTFQQRRLTHTGTDDSRSSTRASLRRECWREFRTGVRQAEAERRRRSDRRRRLNRRHGASRQPDVFVPVAELS